MEKVAWTATIVGCVLGALCVLLGLLGADSVMQEASAYTLGAAFAVIPYCLARALSEKSKLQ